MARALPGSLAAQPAKGFMAFCYDISCIPNPGCYYAREGWGDLCRHRDWGCPCTISDSLFPHRSPASAPIRDTSRDHSLVLSISSVLVPQPLCTVGTPAGKSDAEYSRKKTKEGKVRQESGGGPLCDLLLSTQAQGSSALMWWLACFDNEKPKSQRGPDMV